MADHSKESWLEEMARMRESAVSPTNPYSLSIPIVHEAESVPTID